jgi:putative phage-type endonuclease
MTSRRTTVPWDKGTANEVTDWLGMIKPPRVPAVPAIGPKATDEDWYAARDAGVGASDIGVLMGLSSFASRYSLWWQKHLHLRLPGTDQSNDGHTLEPIVAAEFAARHPELILTVPSPRLWAHRDHPWMICTPDRLAVAYAPPMILNGYHTEEEARELRLEGPPAALRGDPQVIPVELKWDNSPGWGPSGSTTVPPQYALQVRWQAYIFGAEGGWLVNHKPSGAKRYREYWIPVDADTLPIDVGRAFVASLEMGISPDPDGSKATEEILKTIAADFEADRVEDIPPMLVQEWQAAREARAAAISRAREMDNRLREAMGTAGIACDAATGAVVARRNTYKRSGYEVGPAVIDELRMVRDDGGRGSGPEVQGADGEEGADPGAGTTRPEEGDHGDGAEVPDNVGGAAGAVPAELIAAGEAELADMGGVIPASPELVALGDALRADWLAEDDPANWITAAEVEADPGCAPPPVLDTRPADLDATTLVVRRDG